MGQNSPVGRPNSVSHNEPGNEARCSFSHVSEIFKLKNIINAQLTTIAEKQLTIDKQSNMLREYKDENEMLKVKLERSERRMTNLKGRTASGRPVARSHLYDPFISPSEIPPPKSTTTVLAAVAAAEARNQQQQQQRTKNRLLQAKRKTHHISVDPILKKARIVPASATPSQIGSDPSQPSLYITTTNTASSSSSPSASAPSASAPSASAPSASSPSAPSASAPSALKQLHVPSDHAYYRGSAPNPVVVERRPNGQFRSSKPSSSSSTSTKQSSSSSKTVFSSREEARHVENEVDDELRASSRSPALMDATSATTTSAPSMKDSSSGAGADSHILNFESHPPDSEDQRVGNVSSAKTTTKLTKSECDENETDVKVSTNVEKDKSANKSKKKRRVSSGGSGSVSLLLGRLSSSLPTEHVRRRSRMMGKMPRFQQQHQAAAAALQRKKVKIGAESEEFGGGSECQIASTVNGDGDYIFRSIDHYPFFVGDPNYFHGELSPKKSDKEQVEAPVFRNITAPSCLPMEQDQKSIKTEVECLDDDAFLNRHKKGEADEKKRKRWDIQRIRELRNNERLKMGKHSGYSVNWSDPNKKPDESECQAISTFFPDPNEIRFIQVAETVPFCTFGTFLPNISWNLFKVPWSKKELNFLFPPSAAAGTSSSTSLAAPFFGSPSLPRRNAASASKRRVSATPPLKSNLKG